MPYLEYKSVEDTIEDISNHSGNVPVDRHSSYTLRSQIDRISSADPSHCAEVLKKQGRRVLLGCKGVGLEYPGVPGRMDLKSFETRIIFSTMDYQTSDELIHVNKVARRFAAKFNARMIE